MKSLSKILKYFKTLQLWFRALDKRKFTYGQNTKNKGGILCYLYIYLTYINIIRNIYFYGYLVVSTYNRQNNVQFNWIINVLNSLT